MTQIAQDSNQEKYAEGGSDNSLPVQKSYTTAIVLGVIIVGIALALIFAH